MKRFLIVLFALMAVVLARAETWEYASFGFSVSGGTTQYTWVHSEQVITDPSMDGLAKKLVEAGVIPALPAKMMDSVLLNQFGAQGWELVQYTPERTRDGYFERYRFKRRRS